MSLPTTSSRYATRLHRAALTSTCGSAVRVTVALSIVVRLIRTVLCVLAIVERAASPLYSFLQLNHQLSFLDAPSLLVALSLIAARHYVASLAI